jgi:predicted glutamine amidotransferase
MCKVLVIPKVNEATKDKAIAFVYAMGEEMSSGNSDGMGYAAVDKDGNLFGERYSINREFYNRHKEVENPIVKKMLGGFAKSITKTTVLDRDYSKFGDEPNLDKMVAITLHARMATSEKIHKNTHPFVDKDTSLIHNGVIRNDKDFDLKLSTCDSEAILISYLKNKVNINPYENLNNMSSELVGYYVSAVFSRDSKGVRVLDLFKANNNRLCATYIYDLDTVVFASSEFDVKKVCKELGFKFDTPMDMDDAIFLRMIPGTLEVTERYSFKPGAEVKATTYNYTPSTTAGNSNNVTSFEEYKKNIQSKKQNMTQDLIEYHKLSSVIRELSREEEQEFIDSIAK